MNFQPNNERPLIDSGTPEFWTSKPDVKTKINFKQL